MWRKLLFFSSLYFLQGAALAYIINFQKPLLAGKGISKEAIGLFTSLLLIPFIAKVLLGYISDRWPIARWGSRKPYMVAGLLLFSLCYAALASVDPGERFLLFIWLSWLAALGLAWFDTCADGLAVDVALEGEQGYIQASMIAGKSLGLILLSAGFGHLALQAGFSAIYLTLAALAAFVLGLVLLASFQTASAVKAEAVHDWSDLRQKFFMLFAAFGVVYSIASFGTDGLWTMYLSETLNEGLVQVGYFGMVRGGGALMGALAYAALSYWLGMRRLQTMALVMLGFGCLLPFSGLPALAGGWLWGVCWGFQETAYVTLAMHIAKGRWAATIFAIAMIFSNIGTSLGEALGAPLVPRLGFEGVFSLFAVLAWISLAFLPAIFNAGPVRANVRQEPRRALP